MHLDARGALSTEVSTISVDNYIQDFATTDTHAVFYFTHCAVLNYLAKHHLPAGGGLIKAIQAGQLQAFSGGDYEVMLGHWLIKTQALKKWMRNVFQKPSDFPGITVCKAAILLGVKQEVAYALVRRGSFGVPPSKTVGVLCKWFSRKRLRDSGADTYLAPSCQSF